MLQKSLVEIVLRLNAGRKKAIIEEKSATCCRNLLQKGEYWEEKGELRRDLFNMLHNILYNNINIG